MLVTKVSSIATPTIRAARRSGSEEEAAGILVLSVGLRCKSTAGVLHLHRKSCQGPPHDPLDIAPSHPPEPGAHPARGRGARGRAGAARAVHARPGQGA